MPIVFRGSGASTAGLLPATFIWLVYVIVCILVCLPTLKLQAPSINFIIHRAYGYFQVHTRIHTGYKPFACSVCDYRTTQKGNIKIHMTKKHGLPEDEVNLLLHGNISGAQLGGATIAIFQQLGQDSQNATSGNATSSHIHSSPSSFGATAVATSSASALASSSASLTVPSVPSAVSVLTCTGEILSSVRRVSTSLASASALGPSQQISTTPSPSVDARTYSVRSLAHADSASLQDPDDL